MGYPRESYNYNMHKKYVRKNWTLDYSEVNPDKRLYNKPSRVDLTSTYGGSTYAFIDLGVLYIFMCTTKL